MPSTPPTTTGKKRGPYRPREKPNWNTEILKRERAEKKKAKKLETKIARAKPSKPKPLPPLTSLPVEILDVIILNILPSAHSLADYLPHPSETPYPPTSQNVTASSKSKLERWGSIPQEVLDIINFGRCCRQTMRAVDRVVGGLGGYSPSTPADAGGEGKRRLFLRVASAPTGDELFAFALRSRATLEHLVVYNCGGNHCTISHPEVEDASSLNRTTPFQHDHPDDFIPFPRLRSIQLGPDICVECSRVGLKLFAGRTFFHKVQDGRPQFAVTRDYTSFGAWTSTKFDNVAAPELEAVQIHVGNQASKSRHYGSAYSPTFERLIDEDLRTKIKTFSMTLPPSERKWGGFGVGGHTSSVHQKTREAVEKGLAERARAEIVAPGLSNQQKSLDKKIKEKWAAMAKAALVKPAAQERKVNSEAVAALVSSIKPRAPTTLDSASKQTPVSAPVATRPHSLTAEPPVSDYDRQAIANRHKLHQHFSQLLRDIASNFPNLVSLQVLRRGNARADIVEGLLSVDEYAGIYVKPLRTLHRLQQLDLGLAIVGLREVRDFPLGFSLPAPATPETEMRTKIFNRDVAQAVREGDAWRTKVLERFVLGTGEEAVVGFTPQTLAAASEAEVKQHTGWPKGVKSGFVYSADIQQRVMYRGILTSWARGGGAWRVEKGKDGVVFAKNQEKERLVTRKSPISL